MRNISDSENVQLAIPLNVNVKPLMGCMRTAFCFSHDEGLKIGIILP